MEKKYLHALIWAKRHWTGHYRVAEIPYLGRFIDASDVCIDVGAHAGSWLFPLGKLVPSGHVYGFEALPYYAEVLKLTAFLLRSRNTTVVAQAVAARPCHLPLVWRDKTGASLTGRIHLAGRNETLEETSLEVKGGSLDDFFANDRRKISFIKCDVEGAELEVFLGAGKILDRCRPVVYTELVESYLGRYGHTMADMIHLFNRIEYCPYVFSSSDTVVPMGSFEQYSSNDALFVPREWIARL